jgi:3-oxoacyl-[acyl-carrier protein] reductase
MIVIAPGPIKTSRLIKLVKDMSQFENSLPLKRAGKPDEIALFIKSIILNKIKYLNGTTIFFDGGLSKTIF